MSNIYQPNQRLHYIDPSILDIFTLPLVKGDPKTALRQPSDILLTEDMATKFFGHENPIGKTLTVDDRYMGGEYTITGVLKNIPKNSSLQFDFIAVPLPNTWGSRYFEPDNWIASSTYRPLITHIKLAPNASPEDLEKKLSTFVAQYIDEEASKFVSYHLQPLDEVYLYTTSDYGTVLTNVDVDLQNQSDIRYVYSFGAIAGFILLIACANFINLATARSTARAREVGLRKGLVIFQFSLSILLIIGTIIIDTQLTYISTKKLGLNKDQIVVLQPGKHPDLTHRFGILTGHPLTETFRNELKKHPDILDAATFNYFIYHKQFVTVQPEGLPEQPMNRVSADENFLNTFDIKLVSGKGFQKDLNIDETGFRDPEVEMPFLLNETAVKYFGWDDPIGKRFQQGQYRGRVIGVVQDFNNRSLREEIKPIFIMPSVKLKWFAVKIRTENLHNVMQFIEQKWVELIPAPFEYDFLSDVMGQMYRSEKRFEQLSSVFSLLAIFVACLGLWGLAAFTAEKRTREIGIRKTLGASVGNIVVLLSTEFARLVLIANLIAWPVAYYTMTNWLQGFAYRIDLGIGTFLLGSAIALLIALSTVSYQAIRAALTNPIEALRYE